MPILGPRGASSSRGGRGLGPLQNTFGDASTANQAAAAALRATYAGASADWLAQYNADRAFLTLLQWTGGGEAIQRRNVAGDDWEPVTDVITGPAGTPGTPGAAGAGVIITTSATYDAAAGEINLDLTQDPGIPSVLFWRVPPNTDRRTAALSMVANNITADLVDVSGEPVAARRLTPGYLMSTVYFAGQFTLAEVLHPRPQDFDVVVSWSDTDDGPLSAADLVDVSAAFGSPEIVVPATPSGSAPGRTERLWFGVPADARTIALVSRTPRGNGISGLVSEPGVDLAVGGVTYKWWRIGRMMAGSTVYVILGDY